MTAGGLGERLGYDGIKIGLQTELITLRSFIQIYIESIKAYEDRVKKVEKVPSEWYIPFCIMTSEDTHDRTKEFLDKNSNFGMKKEQIIFIKQNKVPAILDNDCHLALQKDKFLLLTKPHGHGDIHFLLYQSGLAQKWLDEGKKYMIQFMDTNALAFNCVLSTIGASVKYNYDINSTFVTRRAQLELLWENLQEIIIIKDGVNLINKFLNKKKSWGAIIPFKKNLILIKIMKKQQYFMKMEKHNY